MPSYRVSLAVGLLVPGVEAAAVLPALVAAARTRTTVEASDLGVVSGRARVTIRFVADDDGAAAGVGRTVWERADALADVSPPRLTRRWGGRWYPLGAGPDVRAGRP